MRVVGAVRRAAAVAAASVLVVAGGWAAPSWACACGAMVGAGDVDVYGESTIVRFGEGTQTVVLRLDVDSAESDAALLLPTPAPAEVDLGDAAMFDELKEVSEPRIEYVDQWWPPMSASDGAGSVGDAPGSGVEVLDSTRLGPFEVATLAADDAAALRDWLDGHGFALEGDLEAALEPYVTEGWYYVAVRLAAGDEEALSGTLDPVRVSFAAEEMVYPMRLTALSEHGQYARLYLLAEHRVDRADDVDVPGEVRYAGRLEAADVESGGLRALVGEDGAYLTTMDHDIWDPSRVTGDFAFAPAASDEPHQEVVRVERTVRIMGFAAGPFLVLVGAVVLLAGAGAAVVLVLRARRSG
ncbi:DUF2330 domain-containing protein [Actinorugispora endophytica]|nr:DUF2330 domain-containing protein [Actinorugispora endophytica]